MRESSVCRDIESYVNSQVPFRDLSELLQLDSSAEFVPCDSIESTAILYSVLEIGDAHVRQSQVPAGSSRSKRQTAL